MWLLCFFNLRFTLPFLELPKYAGNLKILLDFKKMTYNLAKCK